MKFRFFLRGLGVGILFASILLLAAYREDMSNNRLTDAEIIRKAKALGMVEADSKIGSLLTEQNSSTDDQAGATSEKETDTSEGAEEQDVQENEDQETDTQAEDDSVGQNEESGDGQQETVAITIERGDSSYPICQRLQALGMIENASEFDSYMVENGYARRIRVGTHQLKKGMSFNEIAEAISDPL